MSQVRNLRAMFENKGDAPVSPPERGRTLNIPSAASSDSANPLSKIRASFIAVEKDGILGLRRDNSGESSVSRRRMSNETTEGAETAATSVPEKPESATIVEELVNTTPDVAATEQLAPAKAPASLPSPAAPPTIKPMPSPINPVEAPTSQIHAKAKVDAPVDRPRLEDRSPAATKKPQNTTAKPESKTVTSTRPAHLATSSAMKASVKPPTKSPTISKPLASPLPREPKASGTSPSVATRKSTPVATPKKGTAPTLPQSKTPSSSARKPPPIHISPVSGTGFVKPKPKSPTKPVRLPASLTAQTTSSVSKIHGSKPGGLGASHITQPSTRSSSRAGRSTTTAPAARGKSSGISRPRPSVGPPPKKLTQETSAPKTEAAVDEGFLARMMRPTKSSQSKTNGRASTTPPRKRAITRPSTRQAEERSVREGSRVRRVSSTTRLSSRSASPSRAATPGKPAKDVVPAQPIVEEMVGVPKDEVVAEAVASPVKSAGVAPLAVQSEEDVQKPDGVPHITEQLHAETGTEAERPQTPAVEGVKEDIKPTEPETPEATADATEPSIPVPSSADVPAANATKLDTAEYSTANMPTVDADEETGTERSHEKPEFPAVDSPTSAAEATPGPSAPEDAIPTADETVHDPTTHQGDDDETY